MATAEALARQTIDQLLTAAGWAVQDTKQANIHAARAQRLRLPQAETLAEWLQAAPQATGLTTGAESTARKAEFAPATFLARVRAMPELVSEWGEHKLWPAQITAIRNLEKSLAANKPRALR
jgi:hypothetical protein